MKKLILIDSHALIHRAYHALPVLTSPAGEPVHAVYGFTSILLRILRELKPDYIAAAFDLPGPTFRHIAYEQYKATRPETASDLVSQFPKVREVLEAFGIPIFQKEGYEADDIVGTIVHCVKKEKNLETIIITGDMDALQLVGPRVKVYTMRKGISDTVIYDTAAVEARYGFGPERVADFKALKGDPSDNIAGVAGIGDKTAADLVRTFGSLNDIYRAVKKKDKKISSAVLGRLTDGAEDAKFSRELAVIRTDVPIDFDLEKTARRNGEDSASVHGLFQRLGFASLLKRFVNSRLETGFPSAWKPRFQAEHTQAGGQGALRMPAPAGAGIPRIPSAAAFKKFASSARGGRLGAFVHGDALMVIAETDEKTEVRELDKKFLKEKVARDFFAEQKNLFAHDAKSLIRFLRGCGIEHPFISFDLMLAAWLTESFSRDFSLAAIIAREAHLPRGMGEDFFSAADSLERKLADGRLKKVFLEIEMPLAPILADMEEKGVMVDCEFLRRLGGRVDKTLAALTKEIFSHAGEEFNISSSQQLSVILFERLGIKTHGLRKTEKGGVISTRESELEKLKNEHPIVARVLEYRQLAKLKSTYIDALPKLTDKETGRLYTTFNQVGTATGRLSSAEPNVQNIPIMSAVGREIRRAFVAKEGFTLASFDYSQIELRVAAHMAGDKKMIAAFRTGKDIHTMTAAEIYKVPLEQVTPKLRRAAKTLNFGILYGMGPNALAESAGMDKEDAKNFISEYFREFSGVRDFIERTKEFARARGFVESLFGRRRYIPEISSSNPRVRAEAERMAVNMPIQGTATGDIIKMAMIAVNGWIEKAGLQEDAAMLLQVHDELVFEIKEPAAARAAPKIKEMMENAAELSVPLAVDVKIGKNWGEQRSV